jgi:valyl-tRNA synthetase
LVIPRIHWDLINQYGADGVRVGMLLSSPAGNDLMFDEDLCKQGSGFINKIWNSFKLIKSWEIDNSLNNRILQPKRLNGLNPDFKRVLQKLKITTPNTG